MSWMDFAIYHNLKQPGNALPVELTSLNFFFSIHIILSLIQLPGPKRLTNWFYITENLDC